MGNKLLVPSDQGLYCPAGDFHIDPCHPVPRALITHAHGDHASPGSAAYLCADPGKLPLKLRVGNHVETIGYGKKLKVGDAHVSFHPAGHVLGSAQIRVDVGGEVWVVSGDYKRDHDPTCEPFEVVPCHTFITESTFGLPVYRWQDSDLVVRQIAEWWQCNSSQGKPSLLLGYVMGKTQRIMASLAASGEISGPLYAHGALQQMTQAYRASGIDLPQAPNPLDLPRNHDFSKSLIFAPPSALGSPWMQRFKNGVIGRASGWMRIRGRRRRLAIDKGFVLSDHADWPGLLRTIAESKAEHVIVTHGSTDILARYLQESGLKTETLALLPWGSAEETQ